MTSFRGVVGWFREEILLITCSDTHGEIYNISIVRNVFVFVSVNVCFVFSCLFCAILYLAGLAVDWLIDWLVGWLAVGIPKSF